MRQNNRRDSSLLTPRSSLRLPTVGRCYLLVALTLLLIGLYRNINLLLLLGYAMLVLAALNGLAAGRSVRRLRGRRRLPDWVFARTPCGVEVEVSNPGRRPRPGLRVEDGGTDHLSSWPIDQLPGRDSLTLRREISLPQRGRYVWNALTANSGYPFGLVERRTALTASEEVTVLPCPGWLHRGRFLRYLRSLVVQPQQVHVRRKPRAHPAAQAEFHGLRSYRGGDSLRLIHWRTSARRGELMVREFEDEPSDNLLLVVDPTLPAESDYGGVPLREQFEEAISLAASICWEWCRRHGDRLVLATGGPKPKVCEGWTGPVHARHALECLAVLECTLGPSDPAVIASLREHVLPPTLVVLLSLGRSPLADLLPRAVGRPVSCLDATRVERFDFYKPPSLQGTGNREQGTDKKHLFSMACSSFPDL
jgi:uncharacterized protein (DUF58 family)